MGNTSYRGFISKINTDGTQDWIRLFGSTHYQSTEAIATGNDGSIYITGYTNGNLVGETNAGGYDAFLSKYSSDGIQIKR